MAHLDVNRWLRDLERDRIQLDYLAKEAENVTPDRDAKLAELKRLIEQKVTKPTTNSRGAANRKVLVFTAFSDSAGYLYKELYDWATKDLGIHIAFVSGGSSGCKASFGRHEFNNILTNFSPIAKNRSKIKSMPQDGEIDLLIATDCISEGQNLQDCDYLINYDIHWNPVRIIQRFGRIDRIGSKNASIQLVNYWPDISLDEYIRLKERVESRMVIADVTATGDDNPLDGRSNDLAYRKEQLRRLQEEVIELEDLKAGVSITDLGLNDFRMDLLNYVKAHGDLAHLPSGMHAVLPAGPDRGLVPGVIFALRNRNESVNVQQIGRLHPYYMVYFDIQGQN